MRVRNVWIRRKDIKIPETTDLVEFYDNGNNNSVLYNRKQSADRERKYGVHTIIYNNQTAIFFF